MEPLSAEDPERVGDFVLRARLGTGGMGQVFLGRSPSGRAVAVKVVHSHLARQPDFLRRFSREVTAAKAVSGAFTAPVVAAGVDDRPPWLATAYVPGLTLAQAVRQGSALPESSLWPLAAGLVEALQAIHAEDLLHRDLKPSNILLAADGPRVIDFGIVHALDGTALTPTNATIGTPGFMSPEQAEGHRVTPASDVFSLGAVLAYAATSNDPFGQGPPLAVVHRVVNSEPRLDGIPEPVRALIHRCLAKTPTDRPTTSQVLQQITTHWTPPDDPAHPPIWPEAITTLIHTPPPTAPYTPLPADDPTPSALTARYDHALELGKHGEHKEAAHLLAEVAAAEARILGPDTPGALTTRHHHAYHLGRAGQHAEAARRFAHLATEDARVLGHDDPATLTTRHHHAYYVGAAGQHAEAARLFAHLAIDRVRVLGPDHPSTLATRREHDRMRQARRGPQRQE